MKHFQFWVIAVFLGIFNLSMNAQQASRINGTIVDENLFPIENANIILVGTRLGTVSGKNGKFSIIVPSQKKSPLRSHMLNF